MMISLVHENIEIKMALSYDMVTISCTNDY
jgi:hypothetical protein